MLFFPSLKVTIITDHCVQFCLLSHPSQPPPVVAAAAAAAAVV